MSKPIAQSSRWLAGIAAGALVLPAMLSASPASALSYTVKVTCNVPAKQPERQLATNWCLNYLPDGTQTFTARVTTSNGVAVNGATVKWSGSDTNDAHFRTAQNPCDTGSMGQC